MLTENEGVCIQGVLHLGGLHPGGLHSEKGFASNKWAVHILLECILVENRVETRHDVDWIVSNSLISSLGLYYLLNTITTFMFTYFVISRLHLSEV